MCKTTFTIQNTSIVQVINNMGFDIKGKVALITGGASGIGFEYAKALLREEAKGVTLADVNDTAGKTALEIIEKEFGKDKAIFIKTDVTNYAQFEEAFKKTVATYNQVDILINNAGILDDSVWEKQIAINVNGTVHGILLGLENYIQKHKSAAEGLIVNVASIAGLTCCPGIPIYSGTKAAVVMISRGFGEERNYQRTKVKVLSICPGVTDTPLIRDMLYRNLGPPYVELVKEMLAEQLKSQTPEQAAKSLIEVIRRGKSGSVWVMEEGDVYEIETPERWELKKK